MQFLAVVVSALKPVSSLRTSMDLHDVVDGFILLGSFLKSHPRGAESVAFHDFPIDPPSFGISFPQHISIVGGNLSSIKVFPGDIIAKKGDTGQLHQCELL